MFRLCTIFVLVSAAVYTNAAVALFPPEEKPAEFAGKEGCYLKHLNKVLPYGDYYPNNECAKYTCYSTNETQKVTCGVAVIDPRTPCKLISNVREKYPDCCPKIMCSTIPPDATSKTTAPVPEHQTDAVPTTDQIVTEASGTYDSLLPEVTEGNEPLAPGTIKSNRIVYDDNLEELLIMQESINKQ